MKKMYYFFNLEIALKDENDLNIYAYENVSHIPTSKLIEIFKINLNEDPYILEGYFLTKTSYKKHKKYITENIGQINLDVFEYCLRQYIADDFKEIRKLYKETLME
ncbi:MAG: hypothetical protein QM763_01785 [Agriterribacter sp.]